MITPTDVGNRIPYPDCGEDMPIEKEWLLFSKSYVGKGGYTLFLKGNKLRACNFSDYSTSLELELNSIPDELINDIVLEGKLKFEDKIDASDKVYEKIKQRRVEAAGVIGSLVKNIVDVLYSD